VKELHTVAAPNCSAEAFQRGCSKVKSLRKLADFERSCKIDTTPKTMKLLRTAIVDTPAGPQLRGSRRERAGMGGMVEGEGKDEDPWNWSHLRSSIAGGHLSP